MVMRKEAYTLTQILNSIWRQGDQDEMSIKHIGHALAAMVAHNDWRKGDDYNYPDYKEWSSSKFQEDWQKKMDEFLELKWGKVKVIQDKVGATEFISVIGETQFGYHALSYLNSDWLSYYDKLTLELKAKLNSVRTKNYSVSQ